MSSDQLQPDDTLEDRGVDDVLDEGYSPPERQPDHLRHPEGGESLDERLDEEQPEVWAQAEAERDADVVDGDVGGEVGGERSGRLMAPDEGSGLEGDGDSMVAEDEGIDGAGATAEEAAMHTIDDSGDDPGDAQA